MDRRSSWGRQKARYKVQGFGLEFKVKGLGFRVQGIRYKVSV